MASVMEIVVSARDQASGVLEGIGQTADETAEGINVSWAAVGAGMTAAGAGAEAFARSQQDTTVQTRQLAASIGESESAVRAMATETSNATFPLEDVLALMETGRQRGLQSAEALDEYATFWDMVGDATGENATQLGRAGAALAAVGIEAGNEAEAMSALGFVHQETTGSIQDFLHFLDRTGPELRELGADVDDAAAILGVMEQELGMSGRTARQEFRTAVNEADGDMSALLDTLGISEQQFSDMRSAVDESSDVIGRNAEIVAEEMTTMQELSHAAGELIFQHQGLADAAQVVAPVLLALGPIITGVSVAARGLGTAMAFVAANPIVLVIAGVAALVAGLVWLWNNVEAFREFWLGVWQGIQAAASSVATWFTETFMPAVGAVWDWLTSRLASLRDFVGQVWSAVQSAVATAWSAIRSSISTTVGVIQSIVSTGFGLVRDYIVNPVRTAVSWVSGAVDDILGFFRAMPGDIGGFLSGVGDVITAPFRAGFNTVAGGVEGVVNGIAGAINSLPEFSVPGWVPGIGGNTFGLPHIPTISLPRLHDGGVYRAPSGQSEGLALLRDMERVRTPEQEDEVLSMLRELSREVTRGSGRGGIRVENLNLRAFSDRFDLRQVFDQLRMRAAV